ncbi:retrovirus-related Pol polyprotein from transposon 17.6 [Trichonephila inaurata madagascariensis]|uniref:Retrovirus-related Pol polyprotein from transposon 17.6 n=2 Tax=Trichonephila inaurata madagascariensis TaxID=2747483 RepID=A0A8X7BWM3_9ARAC|nr:retrovirus-related Pol polyprotein from transposon 17.6 [Trichonephila inaurata madagascariensis]
MLLDKLIQGLLDKTLQERLIRETSKNARALQEVVSECKTADNSKVQASVMNEKLTVNTLKYFKNYRKQSINNQKNEFNCKQCGKNMKRRNVRHSELNVEIVKGRNHWAKMCRTQSKQKNMAARRMNAMEENSENSDTIYIGELKSVNELDAKETNCVWYEKILVNKNAVTFKLDTGFQVNVIPKSELLKWVEKPVVRNCKIAVLDYSDNRVPILGRLKRIVKIKLKENSVPRVAAPRKVPLAIHNKVKELSNMVEAGIISKVEDSTEWVSNMFVIDSPKKLRICLDPRPLNEAIQRPRYSILTADALITKLQGGKEFTILDVKNRFWQLPLDEESSYLTTFCTPWGRYRFLVLPFGLNSAPEEFQKAMDEIYEEDEDINPYFDDIALGSPTVEEHCRLLRRTLLKARKANLNFNVLKTQLSQTSVNYLGHVLSDEGIKPDPKKIRAIEEFATPNCKADLQRFLGMVTYLAKFTPHLSTLTRNLRQLKKDSVRIWDTNTERDSELVKQAIMKSPFGICSRKEPSNSRCPISRAQSTTHNFDVLGQEATVRINLLTQASPTKWEEIASLTASDPELQDVLFHINNGWPQKKKTKIAAQPYWHCKEELYSTKEGINCRGHTTTSGKEHLLMIDYLSKCVELKPLNRTTAQSVITVMKSIYATHGIPEELVSDGGPPYNSNLMMNFFREWGIINIMLHRLIFLEQMDK